MARDMVLIFLAGVGVDLLVTKYTRCVATGRPVAAAMLSWIITLSNVLVWSTLLQQTESLGVYGALAMASGSSVGTLLGFKARGRPG